MKIGISISGLVKYCHTASANAGWWDNTDKGDPTVQASKIALIHSEISEALEGIRKGHRDSHLPARLAVEVELADALIRIFDLAGAMNLDLENAVFEKLEYNRTRADHSRESRALAGGKRI